MGDVPLTPQDPAPLSPEEERDMRSAFELAVEIGTADDPAMNVWTARRLLATLDAARQHAPSEGLRKPTEDYSPDYSQSFDSAMEWPTTRRLYLEGKTVISQTPTDPGDIGEPRISQMDDTTYVSVPEFECWPTDPDWRPHDASIVFISERAFALNAPGKIAYHLPNYPYHQKTRCGIVIWRDGRPVDPTLVSVRRDVASRIARPCGKCGTDR